MALVLYVSDCRTATFKWQCFWHILQIKFPQHVTTNDHSPSLPPMIVIDIFRLPTGSADYQTNVLIFLRQLLSGYNRLRGLSKTDVGSCRLGGTWQGIQNQFVEAQQIDFGGSGRWEGWRLGRRPGRIQNQFVEPQQNDLVVPTTTTTTTTTTTITPHTNCDCCCH